ncbi:MAG: DUF3304 domain-containing protein [Aquabacterium sp.]|nr:DUF3304 domain-containing protein [Aquabacterium sp.]
MTRATTGRSPWMYVIGLGLVVALGYVLVDVSKAMRAEKKQGTSYVAYNYNARSIAGVWINGEGGILNVSAYGGGGKEVCCVILPSYWRPGLKATIRWEEDGDWLTDDQGQIVFREGRRVYVPRPTKERTVEIPPYIGGEGPEMGRFHIFFLPNDEVAALVSRWDAGFPPNPYPHPERPTKE